MRVLFYFSFVCLHACAQVCVLGACSLFLDVCFVLILLYFDRDYTYMCLPKSIVHCGSAFGPGASGLPYYYTPHVTAPHVIGARAVWRQNMPGGLRITHHQFKRSKLKCNISWFMSALVVLNGGGVLEKKKVYLLAGPQEELRYPSGYTPRGFTSSPGREAK